MSLGDTRGHGGMLRGQLSALEAYRLAGILDKDAPKGEVSGEDRKPQAPATPPPASAPAKS